MGKALKICVCVLAAGASRRMGLPKLLLPLSDTTILQHAVNQATRCKAAAAMVVTGAFHDEMAPLLRELPIAAVRNPGWQEGQASSVRCAAAFARDGGYDALIIMAADQPYVSASTLNALIDEYARGAGAVYASSDGSRIGSPCLFDASCFDLLGTLAGDEGARSLFRTGKLEKNVVAFRDPRLFEDVDTAEDYERIAREFRHGR